MAKTWLITGSGNGLGRTSQRRRWPRVTTWWLERGALRNWRRSWPSTESG